VEYNFDTVIKRYGTYTLKYDDEVYFRKLAPNIRLDHETIRLLLADMDFQCAPAITNALHRVADFGTFGYTTAESDPEYKGSIIRWYTKRYSLLLKPDWLVHSNGALDGVGRTIEAFSAPGDGIIICSPVYSNFTSTIKRLGRKVVNCQKLQPFLGDYQMDWEGFRTVCSMKENKVFVLCSPENPVGRVWKKEELVHMAQICRENNVMLVSDEIHSDIVRSDAKHYPIIQAVEDNSNLVMVSGVNKSFNLMGLQCAYSVIPNDDLRKRFLDGYHTEMPTPFALAAVKAAYDESEEWLNALNAYLDNMLVFIVDYIKEKLPKARVYLPQGTYILWVNFCDYDFSPDVLQYLTNHKANVAVQGGSSHDPEHGGQYLRICLTSPKAVIQEAIDRMAEVFSVYEVQQNLNK